MTGLGLILSGTLVVAAFSASAGAATEIGYYHGSEDGGRSLATDLLEKQKALQTALNLWRSVGLTFAANTLVDTAGSLFQQFLTSHSVHRFLKEGTHLRVPSYVTD